MTRGAGERVTIGAGWARERLWLGMSNVGAWVVAAAVAVAAGVPELGLGAWDPVGWAIAIAAVQLPFDAVGGWWLPRRHGRSGEGAGAWALRWARAAAAHGVLTASALAAAVALYGLGGAALATLGAVVGVVGLLGLQGPWLWFTTGRRGGALPADAAARARAAGLDPARIKVVDAEDGSFVGGWVGLPGAETLVLPARWLAPDAASLLDVQLRRRAAARASGQRARGVVLGASFTLVGVALGLVVFGAADPSDAVRAAALATMWSFVGLLALPTPSRRGVVAVDAAAVRAGLSPSALADAAAALDVAQEDEPARAEVVESIFHPVPALHGRLAAVARGDAGGGAWHAARMALLTSQAAACPLGRAVHCNVGRPELWAVYPGD